MTQILVWQRELTHEHYNPISGHRWATYTPLNMWDVMCPTGVWSTHKSLLAAEIEAASLQAFYDKYPFNPLGASQ